jgi:hypothetical protein
MKPKIGKGEIALLYGVKTKTLIRWIKPFINELESIGYQKYQHNFTQKQIKVIFEKLGEP